MNNNWQFVSLELAKRMKELGFPQVSMFYWWWNKFGGHIGSDSNPVRLEDKEPHNPQGGWNYCSAYSVAELGKMLPWFDKDGNELKISKYSHPSWQICYYNDRADFIGKGERHIPSGFVSEAKTEADARAKMLIWLAENKYIDPKEIKI
jgi:hypothetical protein